MKDIQEIKISDVTYKMKSTYHAKIIELILFSKEIIKIDTFTLDLKEFPKEPHEIQIKQLLELVAFTIKEYYEYYKNK